MDAKTVLEWKAGYDALNRSEIEERRQASYRDRFRSLGAIWRQAQFLGLLNKESLDLSVNDTWQLLRKAVRREAWLTFR